MRLSREKEVLAIAITGGIGSGKSVALDYFKRQGIPVFSADEIAKKVIRKDGRAYPDILELFGPDICSENGEPDTVKLAGLVFGDETKLSAYMEVLRPHIMRALVEEINTTLKSLPRPPLFVIVETPVLFEYGMEKNFDYVLLISCEEKERIRRVMERNGLSRVEVIRRMESQLKDEVKRRGSHFEVRNDGTREELEAKLSELYKELLEIADKNSKKKDGLRS